MYTGTVTVSDPNAVDAPQTVMATVQMGGGVPDSVDLYSTANGGPDSVTFTTNSAMGWGLTTAPTDGSWLAVTTPGAASYAFNLPTVLYTITGTPQVNLAESTYSGSIVFNGSSVAAENKTVPVTLHITSLPIAVFQNSLSFQVPQGGTAQTGVVFLSNRGMNNLLLSGVVGSSASWLSAVVPQTENATSVTVTADPTGLSPGVYTGQLTIGSNAANSPSVVNVQLEVIPAGPPVAAYQGVVNNATFAAGDTVAQGDIVAVFGEQLSSQSPQQGSQLPLVTTLGGAQVLVNGQASPLYYTSYGQINFQIPYETTAGQAVVSVLRDGQTGNQVSVQVAAAAPRILRLGIGDYGIIVNQDNSFPIPSSYTIPGYLTHPAQIGDTLVMYSIGLGPTTPPSPTGAAAPLSPLAQVPNTTVYFGGEGFLAGTPAAPLYSGLTPNFVGLYQVNVTIPAGAPAGNNVNVALAIGGATSAPVQIAIQ